MSDPGVRHQIGSERELTGGDHPLLPEREMRSGADSPLGSQSAQERPEQSPGDRVNLLAVSVAPDSNLTDQKGGLNVRKLLLYDVRADWSVVLREARKNFKAPIDTWWVIGIDQGSSNFFTHLGYRSRYNLLRAERLGAKAEIIPIGELEERLRSEPAAATVEATMNVSVGFGLDIVRLFQPSIEALCRKYCPKARHVKLRVARSMAPVALINASLHRPGLLATAIQIVLTILVAGVVGWFGEALSYQVPQLALMLAVLICAVRFGGWAGMAAAVLGFLTLNAGFTMPRMTLNFGSLDDVMRAALFLSVGGVVSLVVGRLRRELALTRERQVLHEAFFRLTSRLSEADTMADVEQALLAGVGEVMGVGVQLVAASSDAARMRAILDEAGVGASDEDVTAALFAASTDEHAGRGTNIDQGGQYFIQPVSGPGGVLALILIDAKQDHILMDSAFRVFIEGVADQVAPVLERMELARLAEEARLSERTERFRSTVLSAISHDFRTPLASVLGAATSLTQFGDQYDEQAKRELLHSIVEGAERLDRFITKVLELTRLEGTPEALQKRTIDLGDVLDTTLHGLGDRLSNHEVELDLNHPLPLVEGDETLLEHMIANFLDNAAKYSPPGSLIKIRAYAANGGVRLGVIDHGRGIQRDELHHVFERFFRARQARHQAEGAGLGLAICYEIARIHHGRVWVESDGPGKGSRFWVELPCSNVVALESMR